MCIRDRNSTGNDLILQGGNGADQFIYMYEDDGLNGFSFGYNAAGNDFELFSRLNGVNERHMYIARGSGDVYFNPDNNDSNFTISKNTTGDAYVYDAGDDTHTFNSKSIFNGIVVDITTSSTTETIDAVSYTHLTLPTKA